jgi:hypothetical protein
MPNTTYVCLDTNILFRVVSQGQPDCEWELWESLTKLVEDGKVALLLPEVIVLEFQKLTAELQDEFLRKILQIETALDEHFEKQKDEKQKEEKRLWNETADVIPYLKNALAEWKRTKLEDIRKRFESVSQFLKAVQVRLIPFDHQIHFRAHRRFISGTFPTKEKESRPIADCCIIESLMEHFKGEKGSEQLALCTENIQDFGVEVKEGKRTLHPTIRDGLPLTEVFSNLKELMEFLNAQRRIEEPTKEEIDKAVEREKAQSIKDQLESDSKTKSLTQALVEQRVKQRLRQIAMSDLFSRDVAAQFDRHIAIWIEEKNAAKKIGSLKTAGVPPKATDDQSQAD